MTISDIQWRTVLLFIVTYGAWLGLSFLSVHYSLWFLVPLVFVLTLHSSLQHEVIHGHPTPWQSVNSLLAFPALGLLLPFERYQCLHLQHHCDWLLTDPYDDTESYFLSTSQWQSLPAITRTLLVFNNTLLGRLLIGPWIMYIRFFRKEFRSLGRHEAGVGEAWIKHMLGALPVLWWLNWIDLSLLVYGVATIWPATSLLLLRAFTEHLPAEHYQDRSAIVRSGKLMGLLYLNNNLHRVHHDFPDLAWYKIPALFKERYATQVGDHQISGYLYLLRQYALRPRFPVAHPVLRTEISKNSE